MYKNLIFSNKLNTCYSQLLTTLLQKGLCRKTSATSCLKTQIISTIGQLVMFASNSDRIYF